MCLFSTIYLFSNARSCVAATRIYFYVCEKWFSFGISYKIFVFDSFAYFMLEKKMVWVVGINDFLAFANSLKDLKRFCFDLITLYTPHLQTINCDSQILLCSHIIKFAAENFATAHKKFNYTPF